MIFGCISAATVVLCFNFVKGHMGIPLFVDLLLMIM